MLLSCVLILNVNVAYATTGSTDLSPLNLSSAIVTITVDDYMTDGTWDENWSLSSASLINNTKAWSWVSGEDGEMKVPYIHAMIYNTTGGSYSDIFSHTNMSGYFSGTVMIGSTTKSTLLSALFLNTADCIHITKAAGGDSSDVYWYYRNLGTDYPHVALIASGLYLDTGAEIVAYWTSTSTFRIVVFSPTSPYYVVQVTDLSSGSYTYMSPAFIDTSYYSTATYDQGYQEGLAVGYAQGYQTGYTNGYLAGIHDTVDNAYNSGYQTAYNDLYTPRYDAGYTDGYNAGLMESQAAAYQKGYDAGYADIFASNFKLWIVPAIMGVMLLGGVITIIVRKRRESGG